MELDKASIRRNRASNVALFMAAAAAPRSFQKSLLPRNTIDQGIVTGATVALAYGLATVLQDVLDSVTTKLALPQIEKQKLEGAEASDVLARYAVATSLGAIATWQIGQRLLEQSDSDSDWRGAGHTACIWLGYAGIAGLAVSFLENIFIQTDSEKNAEKLDRRKMLPAVIVTGAAIAAIGEFIRSRSEHGKLEKGTIKPLQAAGTGIAVAGALGGVALVERQLAKIVDKQLQKSAPWLKNRWLPLGHVAALSVLGGTVYLAMQKIYHDIENGAAKLEPGFAKRPTAPEVSGSKQSHVAWSSLSLQGRRHVASHIFSEDVATVMGRKKATPVRVYVGLDSAETRYDRVQLALKELKRTKAYDRDVLAVMSPTGTGYLNYVYTEALEYFTYGSAASVAIQYSKRPSPMSLDRVPNGHVQYRMLLNGIARELANRPAEKRPKIVLFGESLGAWTSQDAFMHEGTDVFKSLGIDNALWIGTPAGSKWHDQVMGAEKHERLNVESELVGEFANYKELQAVPQAKRKKIRYVFLTNHNDPIAFFSARLLVRAPKWLQKGAPRPKGLPTSTRWRTPATFIHTLIDMKSALSPTPGDFVANGHDYRGTLARFVNEAYHLGASEAQMKNVEAALRRNEVRRSEMIDQSA